MKYNYTILMIVLLFWSCNSFEYSPDQTFDRDSPKKLNKSAIEKLTAIQTTNDTLRFILSGDTQRSYKEMPSFIEKVNSFDNVDFVLVAGDITEFGSLKEMELYANYIKNSDVPIITVVGNHDLTGRGRTTYQNMFGDLNFSFAYKGTKFIAHDTNSREYRYNGQVPDLGWLEQEMLPEPTVNAYVAIAHIPTFSDDFDQKLVPAYNALFQNTPGFISGLYGHTHTYITSAPEDPFPYLVTGSVQQSECLLITIINNTITHERIYF